MVKRIITSLSTLISDAQERGFAARNVVKDLPSRRKRGNQAQHESCHRGKLNVGVDIPSPDEIRAFLGALSGRYRPLLLTATFTGLRASELRGLRTIAMTLDTYSHLFPQEDAHAELAAAEKSLLG